MFPVGVSRSWSKLTLTTITIAYGFLASKEVKNAGVGNLGLQDREYAVPAATCIDSVHPAERLALRWVQKYISAFGGDPTKVTMYARPRPTSLLYFAD